MAEKEYIEREAVLEIVKRTSGDYAAAWSEIRQLPAADVAPVVHGEWRWEGKFKACSKCGTYVEWAETLGASFWNYCPYCGAKMDGGEANE